jgi:hypothetical protein
VYFSCSPGGDAFEGLAAISVNAGDYIALWQAPESVEMTETPMGWGRRFLLGAGFGFFGGCLTLIGAWIWRYAAGASAADNIVADVSLAVTVASTIVFMLGRRRGLGSGSRWHANGTNTPPSC